MLYSYSRIRQFEKCPLAYRFEYIDRVETEEFDTIEAFMGSVVHESLDVFYGEAASGNPMSKDALIGVYSQLWEENIRPGIVINSKEMKAEDYLRAGEKCLKDYYLRYAPFDGSKVVGTEVKVLIDLFSDGRYRFIGYIDRLDRTDNGGYEIHDYKTGENTPSKKQTEKDQQLALYELGIRQKHADASDVELVWHYLRSGLELRAKKTGKDLADLKTGLASSVDRIEKAARDDFFPAKKTNLCRWCAYDEICRQEKKAPLRQTSLCRYTDAPQDRYYELEM